MTQKPKSEIIEDKNYLQTLEDIKQRVKTAQIKAHLSVNKEMLILYWQIGKIIIEQRKSQKWGSKVIDKLASDLKSEFSTIKGLSTTNLKYMAIFAENYPDLLVIKDNNSISQQAADQLETQYFVNDKISVFINIPWFHNVEIMTQVQELSQRIWYAAKTIENGWSRNVLVHQITTDLYHRQSDKITKTNNFNHTLPLEQSEVLQQLIKDEYNLEFIDSANGLIKERRLENAIVDNIIKFLLELGQGFAFVGKQYHLSVDDQDFYIDLLFYHIKLKSYIVIELKTGKFKPEYAGKMGFYLACVDDYLKDKNDNNSIGIILCQDESKEVKEKSLQCMIKPIGVAHYKLAKESDLPKELKPIEEIKKIMK